MHLKRILSSIAAIAVAVCLAPPAAACTFDRDEWGRAIVDCDFSHFWADLDFHWKWEPPCCVPEINLTIDQFDYEVFGGNDFQINVDLENHGNIDAGPFEVVGVVAIKNGWTGEDEEPQVLRVTIPGLPAGAVERHRLGIAYLPDRRWTYWVQTYAVVDPPLMGQGDVIAESNENDNEKDHDCRIEGMSSAWALMQGPPPPCN